MLFLSVESSLQTSIIWDRSTAWWTPWLYKIGPFSIADIIIILITVVTINRILLQGKIGFSQMKYRLICLFAFIYLYLGFIYNIGIYTFWKTYLYDVKAFLYLTIPYFFLYTLKNSRTKIIEWFTPRRIFTYCIVASFIDWAIVNIIGQIEYPQHLHLPVIPVILQQ